MTFLERCPTSRNSNFGLQQIESLVAGNPDHCMRRDWVERLFKTVEGHGRPETSLQGRTRGRVLKSLSTQLCLAPNLFGKRPPPTCARHGVGSKLTPNSGLAEI